MKKILFIAFNIFFGVSMLHAAVDKQSWGKTSDGAPIDLYTLTDHEVTVRITTFGARVVSIETPGRSGKKADIVLGYNNSAQYEKDKNYFGAIVGRYGNRIAKGTFSIDGQTFHVPPNDGANALHGGTLGFDHKVWSGREIPNGVEMILISPDGDMGFPGQLTAHVTYTLDGKSLRIHYSAATTKPTVVNLTNHSYFNLAGNGSGDVLKQIVTIDADHYTPVDSGLIPTGEITPVAGTPFDLRKPTPIGAHIDDANEQLKLGKGYDHNFVLNKTPDAKTPGKLHLAVHVSDPDSGRTLTVTTSEPGVQFYTGNVLDGTAIGKTGVPYLRRGAFCVETQHFPDSPNQPKFPSTLLRPGHTMQSTTIFTFGTSDPHGK